MLVLHFRLDWGTQSLHLAGFPGPKQPHTVASADEMRGSEPSPGRRKAFPRGFTVILVAVWRLERRAAHGAHGGGWRFDFCVCRNACGGKDRDVTVQLLDGLSGVGLGNRSMLGISEDGAANFRCAERDGLVGYISRTSFGLPHVR